MDHSTFVQAEMCNEILSDLSESIALITVEIDESFSVVHHCSVEKGVLVGPKKHANGDVSVPNVPKDLDIWEVFLEAGITKAALVDNRGALGCYICDNGSTWCRRTASGALFLREDINQVFDLQLPAEDVLDQGVINARAVFLNHLEWGERKGGRAGARSRGITNRRICVVRPVRRLDGPFSWFHNSIRLKDIEDLFEFFVEGADFGYEFSDFKCIVHPGGKLMKLLVTLFALCLDECEAGGG